MSVVFSHQLHASVVIITATVSVAETVKPSISEMSNMTQREGSRLVLNCRTRGDPAPTITFHKDDQPPYRRGDNVSTRCMNLPCLVHTPGYNLAQTISHTGVHSWLD